MDGSTCALCGRAILSGDRAIFLGIERLLFHGGCYDEVRGRRREEVVSAARHARSA